MRIPVNKLDVFQVWAIAVLVGTFEWDSSGHFHRVPLVFKDDLFVNMSFFLVIIIIMENRRLY